MNFDSHASGIVSLAVATVNLLTAGHAHGREYRAEDCTGQVRSLLRPPRTRELSERDVDRLRDYAAKLRQVFAAVDAGRVDDACEQTNALLRETHAVPVLSRHDGEPWHLHFHAPNADWARSWAAAMATGLAVVLGNPIHDRLGVCTAPACDRVFVDTSRNGTRRFCSTSCQNRVKTATFRARQRVG
ncbi:CGNR zinc finger domain-containing protein [Amycolatopsis taiwanensis]|uniref:CGNR zinc finger domain-containing protein n=1 Tax=Amycolatopsis taiwanensis TaxID=342230 RepID=UPI0004895AC8|nr:CGNR zinc finger domain-containing protein [Amycolatopsis taiwanensis]